MPTNLVWEVFFWLMGKCTFTLMWDEKKVFWHSQSLREFVPCYVREIFAFEGVLTFAAFRLNNRDTLRERPPMNDSNSAFRIASVRPNETSYKSKTEQTAVTFAVNQTVTSDFAQSSHDSDNELALDKSVRVFLSVAALCHWDSHVSGGGNHHRLCTRRITRVNCIGFWPDQGNSVVG